MNFEDYLTDLDQNERIQIERDPTRSPNSGLAVWRIASQPPGGVRLGLDATGCCFRVNVANASYEPAATGQLVERVRALALIAAALNGYLFAVGQQRQLLPASSPQPNSSPTPTDENAQ